jgi:hypothetical protein
MIVSGNGSNPYLVNPNQSILDQINSGAYRVYVHGRIDYDDVFRQKHWTTFCFHLTDGAWASCREHNDADNTGLNQSFARARQPQPIIEPQPCPTKPN